MRSMCMGIVGSCLTVMLAVALGGCGGDSDKPSTTGGGEPAASDRPKFDETKMTELQKTKVQGFSSKAGMSSAMRTVVTYADAEEPTDRGAVRAMVVLEPCNAMTCGKLDPDYWKGREDEFVAALGSRLHRENEDLHWSYGSIDLGDGRKGIYTYVRSYAVSEDGRSKERLLTYKVIYNDGANAITIDLNPENRRDAKSQEDLEALMSEEDGRRVAQEIFAAFAGSFG